ncbi:MauE/DoxX family redox-associated membrane protein [Streptomyces sp. CC208A]|uniref:MauE/DoxX family redox-associated membrane protein n=1 Tax=Streptomyces sp. CC208A TaxID=3044573 RepID=UPI0024AA00E1|nr:MauE/DoxX family redox-associated membrane protein [Streptomyces sp. CC208A]
MGYVLLSCRLLLGVVFAVSAVGKLRGATAFRAFEGATRSMGVPGRFARPVAVAVVGAECAVPVLLAVGPAGAPGIGLALVLLAAFTVGIAGVLRRGTRTSCACFGASSAVIGRRHLVRNGLLLLCAGIGAGCALGGVSSATHAGGVVIAAVAALVGALLVTFTDELGELFGTGPTRPAAPIRRSPRSPA